MRLVLLSEWLEQAFPSEASRPALNTVYRWIRSGRFPEGAVQRYGHRYFVNLDRIETSGDKVSELVKRALGDESKAA